MPKKITAYRRHIGIVSNARVAALHDTLQQIIAMGEVSVAISEVYEIGLLRTIKKLCEHKGLSFETQVKPLLELREIELELEAGESTTKPVKKPGRKRWVALQTDQTG